MEISSASSRRRAQPPGRRPEPQRGRPASAGSSYVGSAFKLTWREVRLKPDTTHSSRTLHTLCDLSGLCAETCSPQRSVAKRALDCSIDALAGELPLLAEEPDDAV